MEGGEKKFSQIPAYSGLRGVVRNASHVQERRTLIKQNKSQEAEQLPVHYICGYHDIPDKNLVNYPLYSTEIKAQDVDYDLIVYDTYDYLDKLIGFKLSDIFYAIFDQYYTTNADERARKLALYFKYGTDKDNEIWMLRYGLTFEDIEWLAPCIEKIDEMEIVFNNNVQELTDEQKKVIEPYFYE